MKNLKSIRIPLLTLVVFMSLSSFVFLNFCAPAQISEATPDLIYSEQQIPDAEVELPDLQMVDHLFKTAVKILKTQ